MDYRISFEDETTAIVKVYSAGNVTWEMKMQTPALASKTVKEQKELIINHMMKVSFHTSSISNINSVMPHVSMVENGLEIQRPKRKKRGGK